MKKVLILGASGNIARRVVDMLIGNNDIELTLLVRNARRLQISSDSKCEVVVGDVLNYPQLKDAVKAQEIVYGNLAGDLGAMARNVVRAMDEQNVKRLIFISSIGIYDTPLKPVLRPYKEAADAIESSGLDYTVIRPTWFTDVDEIDYEITHKGEPEIGSLISEKSLAALIAEIIMHPEMYVRESIGVNKPNS